MLFLWSRGGGKGYPHQLYLSNTEQQKKETKAAEGKGAPPGQGFEENVCFMEQDVKIT